MNRSPSTKAENGWVRTYGWLMSFWLGGRRLCFMYQLTSGPTCKAIVWPILSLTFPKSFQVLQHEKDVGGLKSLRQRTSWKSLCIWHSKSRWLGTEHVRSICGWAEALLTLKWPVVAPTATNSWGLQTLWHDNTAWLWMKKMQSIPMIIIIVYPHKSSMTSTYINLCRGSSAFNDQKVTQPYLREHLRLGPGSGAEVWPQGEAGPGLRALR